jgi:NADH:ubiquinone oxidoreductase subunit 3 (subunit A)
VRRAAERAGVDQLTSASLVALVFVIFDVELAFAIRSSPCSSPGPSRAGRVRVRRAERVPAILMVGLVYVG